MRLNKQDMIHPKIRDEVLCIITAPFVFPEDILNAIKCDSVAWKNYQKLSDSYKRIRIAYLNAARNRPIEFEKRLKSFIKKTHDGRMIAGYGGTDKYN